MTHKFGVNLNLSELLLVTRKSIYQIEKTNLLFTKFSVQVIKPNFIFVLNFMLISTFLVDVFQLLVTLHTDFCEPKSFRTVLLTRKSIYQIEKSQPLFTKFFVNVFIILFLS